MNSIVKTNHQTKSIYKYDSFFKHVTEFSLGNIAALSRHKHSDFCDCVMETFRVLCMHPDPRFKAFFDDSRVGAVIASEMNHWITTEYYAGRLHKNESMPWFKQFEEIEMGNLNPFAGDSTYDHRLHYLFDNISAGGLFLGDVIDTLESIRTLDTGREILRPVCIEEAQNEEREYGRSFQYTCDQKEHWLDKVSARAIAVNAFNFGWEVRMLSIVRDFIDEISKCRPVRCHMMLSFLSSIKINIQREQQKEEDYNMTAAVMLFREGLNVELQRMILPVKSRIWGIPLANMPKCLN